VVPHTAGTGNHCREHNLAQRDFVLRAPGRQHVNSRSISFIIVRTAQGLAIDRNDAIRGHLLRGLNPA
jgi:hypothetical protein